MPAQLSPYEIDVLPFVRPFTDELVASVIVGGVDRVLDHGSGTGEVVVQLRRAGLDASVVALEPNVVMMQRLQQILASQPATETFQGLLREFVASQPGERFDLVTSQLVLSFVDDPIAEL